MRRPRDTLIGEGLKNESAEDGWPALPQSLTLPPAWPSCAAGGGGRFKGMTKRPAHDVGDADAQAEYDADPALRELLTQAAQSPTVHRDNAAGDDNDADDAHRERVHDSADRALNKDADLLQRLKDDNAGSDGSDADGAPDGGRT